MKNQISSAVYLLSVTIALLFTSQIVAQDSGSRYTENELVTLSDSRITTLTKRYNISHAIYGYRVQIISASKKEKAKKAKSIFASRYHGYFAHEIYQQPFFIIKVGDFLTKIEAENLHREIRNDFPESFVLPDIVNPIEQYTSKD
jgi:hypothetical protein